MKNNLYDAVVTTKALKNAGSQYLKKRDNWCIGPFSPVVFAASRAMGSISENIVCEVCESLYNLPSSKPRKGEKVNFRSLWHNLFLLKSN